MFSFFEQISANKSEQAGDLLLSDTALNAPEEDKFLNASVTPRADRVNTEVINQIKFWIHALKNVLVSAFSFSM